MNELSGAVTAPSYMNEPVKYSSLTIVDLVAEAGGVAEEYRNLVLFQVNQSCLRLSVFNEVFPWHVHPSSDELFLVVEGTLVIELADGREIQLKPWQSVTVAAGTVHRTRAIGRTVNLCFEKLAAETVFVDAPEAVPVADSAIMSAIINLERPDTADAVELITELEAHLETLYPSESRHGYSVEKLIAQGVAFFVLRDNGIPAGCGGIQLFGSEYGEVKRMYVRPRFRGLGFGKLILNHLADYARARGAGVLRLETGIHQPAAIRLYERFGFQRIPPFGSYIEDPLCLYYEKRLMGSETSGQWQAIA